MGNITYTDPGYVDNISYVENRGRQVTVRCNSECQKIIHIGPKEVTWPTWIETSDRYRLKDEELVGVDIGPTGIQLTFKKVNDAELS